MTTENKVRKAIVVKHPLQPFDTRNVIPGKLIPHKPFTFDSSVLNAARARSGHRAEKPPFISGPLPAPPPDDVVLADLVAFFRDPVKGFYRALDFTLPWEVDGVEDAMPVDINALEEWTVGDRMLDDMLHDMEPAQAREAEWRRGTLPPGRLGWRKATEICEQATFLAEAARAYRREKADAVDVDIDLGGRRLTGTVSPVFGDRLVSVTYSKLGGRHRLQSWIPLLALLAHDPSRDWAAVCIGRARKGTTPQQDTLRRPAESAVDLLADLVAMYDEGRREPLPLPTKTSFAWAEAVHSHGDPERSAGYRWRSDRYPGDDAEPAHVRTWGQGRVAEGSRRRGSRPTTPVACGCRCCERWTRDGQLRPVGSAARAAIDHGVGGERGNGQDVRVGGSGHAVRRRGCGDAGPDALDHVQPFGHAGTARPCASPDRRCHCGFRRPIAGRRQPGDRPSARLRRGRRPRAPSPAAATTPWRLSTPRRSPPPTSSVRWCSSRSGWRVTPMPV